MARFDDFTLSELIEVEESADGLESWYGEMYAALERRAALDGVTWPPVPVATVSGAGDVNVILEHVVATKIVFGGNLFDTITHNWGL